MAIANYNLGNDLYMKGGDLVVGVDGDLATCDDGLVTLVQDVIHGLETTPGDLFGHETSGAGVRRLLGEDDPGDLVARAISDFLLYDPWVAPRIVPESIDVTRLGDEEAPFDGRFRIVFSALDADTTTNVNLVWNANTNTVEELA